ncbi:response regulator transcription factor [Mucilaginibacter robiniae]|uniref:Response regulator transcription factor n=1 Tax=Mucilaginibacter robiniae TaxID=2728022 RepID=A0A7L5E2M5_9SPHI|nr:response regulator transcription factor [Mucilaginibacter robiniae]QJD96687.1 response regulator transcription factor [Mucilaginibacter robiniae]
MINIILAEDHNIVRDGLKSVLHDGQDFAIVAEARNGKEVIDFLESGGQADILLTDMTMPVMGGLELTEKVTQSYASVSVVVLSALDHEKYVMQVFKAGAAAYLLKSVSTEELHFAIKHVQANGKYICSELTMRFLERMMAMPEPVPLEMAADAQFTSREIEVLQLIADGYTNQEIADTLFTSKRTVEGHRQALIDKTGARNTPALIKLALLNGMIS